MEKIKTIPCIGQLRGSQHIRRGRPGPHADPVHNEDAANTVENADK